MGWRQTFYTFLLRRVLGPYLSPESLKLLYNSIDVSLQEGRFSLNDIELNSEYLSTKVNAISIHYVRIKKLHIRLTLRDNNEASSSNVSTATSNNVTWRAMNLGREGAGGVSLEAHLEFDGVDIHVGPRVAGSQLGCAESHGQNEASASTASKTIGSYVDAALASLRLALDVKNAKLRILGGDEEWIELDLAHARYHDGQSHDTAMHKAIDFSGIAVQTFIESRKDFISKLEGGGQIALHANNICEVGKLKQDLSISLHQRINLSVGEHSLKCLWCVAKAFSHQADTEVPSMDSSLKASRYNELTTGLGLHPNAGDPEHDAQDIQTIQGIMEQYAEARHLAERNEVRGGILVPDDDTMSFDAFFDANDLSFSTYKSTLERSLVLKTSSSADIDDYVHTQIKLHLGECRIKISFPNRDVNSPLEYLLITFSDCNASSAISNRSTEVNCFVGRLAAEASQLSDDGLCQIEKVWCFEEDDDCRSIVSSSPCVDLHIGSQLKKKSIGIRLRNMTIFYSQRALENIKALHALLKPNELVTEAASFTKEKTEQAMSVSIWMPSITLLVPVSGIPITTFHTIFQRCGYRVEDELLRDYGFLGIALEDVVFTTLNAASDDIAEGVSGEKVSVHRALMFVSAPMTQGSTVAHRLDILALAGQIPLTIKHSMRPPIRNIPSEGEAVFPKVPTLSSFKVREDDDVQGSDEFEIVRALRPSDPQPTLLRMARECHETIDIRLPDVTVDLTKAEMRALCDITVGIKFWQSSTIVDAESESNGSRKPIPRHFAVALSLGQVTLCAHSDKNSFSFKVVGRDWTMFSTLRGHTISCLRAMTHEIDLYTAQDLIYRAAPTAEYAIMGINDRCDVIRKRTVRNPLTKSSPIFYRSQLFPPLSPESPALLIDLINSSDEESSDWTVHFSLYNLTHRATVDSNWYMNAQELLESGHRIGSVDGEPDLNITSLTSVFATLSDCNVDYTSPCEFNQASRTILRVSDARLSSNIVSPPQQVQLFSLSVGDVTFLVANKRHPYNSENACLSRSVTIVNPDDLDVVQTLVAAPDLQQMNLVTMLTLDYFVAGITLRGTIEDPTSVDKGPFEPKISLNLTFGSMCLYGCKDSFECLMETVRDLSLRCMGLTDDDVDKLRQKDLIRDVSLDKAAEYDASGDQRFFDSNQNDSIEFCVAKSEKPKTSQPPNALQPVEMDLPASTKDLFDLDGYDWTAIDHKWPNDDLPADEEQLARWFSDSSADSMLPIRSTRCSDPRSELKKVNIVSHHIQVKDDLNPLAEGDMDASRHAGTEDSPLVKIRILVSEGKARFRFFDGYDWPQDVRTKTNASQLKYDFIIDDTLDKRDDQAGKSEKSMVQDPMESVRKRRHTLMGELLDDSARDATLTFREIPLAEERGSMLMEQAGQRRLARRMHRFLQVSLSGLQLRIDSFEESTFHRLVSCLDIRVKDLFIAETISNTQPTKLLGEWVNDVEHPRETKHGLAMMRMVTWNPKERVRDYKQINPQESEVVIQFLPLRCHIYQRALRFARAFFTTGEPEPAKRWASHLTPAPSSLFVSARVKPCKLKVNYTPDKVDVTALRNGAVVELINISPLNDMVIILEAVNMDDTEGFGAVLSTLARCWIQDICSTQLHKFVTNNSAVQPLSNVSNDAVDMVVLPWEAAKSGTSVSKAVRKGVHRFADTLVYETLNVGSKVSSVAAGILSKPSSSTTQHLPMSTLPSRPLEPPRKLVDTTEHSFDTIVKGFEAANYKIIIIPYREYRRSGAAAAVTSAIRGIPLAVMAPVGAATEAISYTLLGARNQVRPEVRKEDEASQRGL